MRLLITFGKQVLIKDPATEADYGVLTEAKKGDPDAVLSVECRTSEDGPSRPRLLRAGRITKVTRVTTD